MLGQEWDALYSTGKHDNSWPWSDLVSLYFRYFKLLDLQESGPKVLELGSGTGNNFRFWSSQKADYFGIEMSNSAVEICVERFPELRDKLDVKDFSQLDFEIEQFDIICDRASVTHCNNSAVKNTIQSSFKSLKKGGLYFGIDWFSKNHSDFQIPSHQVDSNTRSDFMAGQFMGLGQVHFVNREEILGIFKDFEIIELTEKIVSKHFPAENYHQLASWNVVARKPL